MKTEFELRFVSFPKNLREKLKAEKFICTKPKTRMKMKVFHFKPNDTKWARIRDEGGLIRMSMKEIIDPTAIDGVKEVDLIIDKVKAGEEFLKSCGMYKSSGQEKDRETWQKNNIEIVFDTWPGLPEMIEIEGDNEKQIRAVADKLGLLEKDIYVGALDEMVTELYGIPKKELNEAKEITFKNPLKIKERK